ncbi:MAG TPA: phosphoglycerate dehydrogenase, partial [Thermomicrobiales bacterium]|nr:phosphoglycerate dehydrogenase [Thermomicrobiales bacterium]
MATPFRLTPDCRIAVDLDGVLTEHPRPLARAASDRFGLDLPERAFVDSAGLNVPEAVREWVYGSDGPATKLSIARGAVAFLERVVEITGQHNVVIITARPRSSTEPTVNWLREHGLPAVEIFFA